MPRLRVALTMSLLLAFRKVTIKARPSQQSKNEAIQLVLVTSIWNDYLEGNSALFPPSRVGVGTVIFGREKRPNS